MEARALFVICTRVITLHSCYMKNAFVFSQSEARNFFSGMLLIKKPERDERYLSAVNLHNWRLPSISTSNIPHVAEDGDWFGVQTEGNKSTDIRSIKKKRFDRFNVINQSSPSIEINGFLRFLLWRYFSAAKIPAFSFSLPYDRICV